MRTGTLMELIRQHMDGDAQTSKEANRLKALAMEKGFSPSEATIVSGMSRVRLERYGLPSVAPTAYMKLLKGVQAEIAAEVGFNPTVTQVVEKLIAVYRKSKESV